MTDKKNSPRKRAKQNNKDLPTTKVHILENSVNKYITGHRKPISIQIDEGLYKAFKPVAKRLYGSVCRAVEIYMCTLIETAETGVYFSRRTKPININKIVIARNVRPRRMLEVNEDLGLHGVCGHSDCEDVAFGSGEWRGSELLLCENHYNLALSSHDKRWGEVQLLEASP